MEKKREVLLHFCEKDKLSLNKVVTILNNNITNQANFS